MAESESSQAPRGGVVWFFFSTFHVLTEQSQGSLSGLVHAPSTPPLLDSSVFLLPAGTAFESHHHAPLRAELSLL